MILKIFSYFSVNAVQELRSVEWQDVTHLKPRKLRPSDHETTVEI